MKIPAFFFVFYTAFSLNAFGVVWYVDIDNTGGPWDGTTWATAFTTIQEGIDAAFADGGGEVWVAEGVYDEARTSIVHPPPDDVNTGSVVMKGNVHLYGGFAGTETARSQRDWENNVTTIDGSISRGGSPAYHVIFGADNATLDGFIIAGGSANGGVSGTTNDGGGMYNNNASPTLTNCTFTANWAGRGGAIAMTASSLVTIINCLFTHNSADSQGGAVSTDESSPVIRNCAFIGNSSPNEGSAVLNNNPCTPTIVNCLFVGNFGSVSTLDNADRALTNAINLTVAHNSAGGINNHLSASGVIKNCIVWDNTGYEIQNDGSSNPSVTYCDVQGGYLTGTGNIDNDPQFMGGPSGNSTGLVYDPATLKSILTDSAGGSFTPSALTGDILWIESPPDGAAYYIAANNATTITVWGDATEGGTVTSPVAYFIVDYHIDTGSPCIDTGTNTGAPLDDIDGDTRPYNGTVDMGADEYDPGPQVSSITIAGISPTNAALVGFIVAFDRSVTGVDSGDFAIDTTGTKAVTGASVTGVSGSGTTYTVTVNTGSGDGTLSIDLTDNDSIQDGLGKPLGGSGAGNGDYAAGQYYTIDKTAPTVSIGAPSVADTATGPVTYTVTYSGADSVTLANGDVTLNTTGTATGTENVTGSGTDSRTVTISGISGDGTLGISIGAGTASDTVGNLAAAAGPSSTFNVDNTAPTVQSITRADSNPTNASSVNFTVTFDESVTGVDSGDFAIDTTGTKAVTGASVTGVSGSGATYTVTVNTGSGDGTLSIDLTDDDSIQDGQGNPLGGPGAGNGDYTAGENYIVDKTGPSVQSITRADSNPTNASSVNFTVTFTESVTGVDSGDFTIDTTGNKAVTGASVTGVSGSGDTYTVTVNTGSGDGTLSIDVIDDDSIQDGQGNPLGGSGAGNGDFTAGEDYTVDKSGGASLPVSAWPLIFVLLCTGVMALRKRSRSYLIDRGT